MKDSKEFKDLKKVLLGRAKNVGMFSASQVNEIEDGRQYLSTMTKEWRHFLALGLVDDELLLEYFTEEELKAANIYAGGKHVIESATAYVCGEAVVEARGSSCVEAYDVAVVVARDSSVVKAYDYVKVKAYDSAVIEVGGETEAEAHDKTTFEAYGGARVKAYDSATIEASGFSVVEVYSPSAVVKAVSCADVETHYNG